MYLFLWDLLLTGSDCKQYSSYLQYLYRFGIEWKWAPKIYRTPYTFLIDQLVITIDYKNTMFSVVFFALWSPIMALLCTLCEPRRLPDQSTWLHTSLTPTSISALVILCYIDNVLSLINVWWLCWWYISHWTWNKWYHIQCIQLGPFHTLTYPIEINSECRFKTKFITK